MTRLICVCVCLGVSSAWAQPAEEGLRLKTDVGIRAIPIGVNAITDTGYRLALWDSESQLLRKTYIEAGVNTGLSPAYLWAGGYVEALPVAVLQLRGSVHYIQFFGTFGHLFEPVEGTRDWTLDDLDAQGEISDGKVTRGLMIEGRATPRLKVGNLVAFAELRFIRISVEDVADTWYEPYYDMLLEGTDSLFIARPTLGYLLFAQDPARTYLLAGARWERTQTSGTDLKRDLLAALLLWKVPTEWWAGGKPRVALLAGAWLDHPNDRSEPYIAAQLTLEYGAK